MNKFLIIIIPVLALYMVLFFPVTDAFAQEETEEEVNLFNFDFEPEASLLFKFDDGTVDYGLGANLFTFYKDIFYFGGIYVPGENLSTDKGEGRSALYGPKIGADILRALDELKIPLKIPIERLRLGTAWLGNFEGGLEMEKYPRAELSYLF